MMSQPLFYRSRSTNPLVLMFSSTIVDILLDFRYFIDYNRYKQGGHMIKRNLYLKQIRPFYNTPMVKVLTGIRRSGKSTMLFLVQEDLKSSGVNENQFFRLNMEAVEGMALKDSDDLLGMLTSFFSSLVEGEKGYVFLDEVQLLSGWERVVNACNTSYNADIYITGSNASLLSSDL